MLLARLFESLPLTCPNCGADMRIIAFVTDAAPVKQILTHIGEPPRPPPITPLRYAVLLRLGTSPNLPGSVVRCFSAAHPPAWDEAPEPEIEFDHRIAW